MFYRNRGGPVFYSTGCSTLGCLLLFFLFSFLVGGGLVFFFRYFWLIVVLGLVVWLFRNLFDSDDRDSSQPGRDTEDRRQNWHRDYENRTDTGYDNINRNFEEVDEDEENKDEFDDF